MSDKQVVAGLTSEQLATIAAVVAAAVKPPAPSELEVRLRARELAKLEAEERSIEAAKQMAREQGEQELATKAARRQGQIRCTHGHQDGSASVASVENFAPYEPNTNFIVCLHCQGKIKPAPGRFDQPDEFIYDEQLYYKLLATRKKTDF